MQKCLCVLQKDLTALGLSKISKKYYAKQKLQNKSENPKLIAGFTLEKIKAEGCGKVKTVVSEVIINLMMPKSKRGGTQKWQSAKFQF